MSASISTPVPASVRAPALISIRSCRGQTPIRRAERQAVTEGNQISRTFRGENARDPGCAQDVPLCHGVGTDHLDGFGSRLNRTDSPCLPDSRPFSSHVHHSRFAVLVHMCESGGRARIPYRLAVHHALSPFPSAARIVRPFPFSREYTLRLSLRGTFGCAQSRRHAPPPQAPIQRDRAQAPRIRHASDRCPVT